MTEQWKTVVGFPDYEVSDLGKVRDKHSKLLRKQYPVAQLGYPSVSLFDGNKWYTQPVHKHVLTTFCGPRPPNQQCRHLNGKHTDNRLANLVWGTPKQNKADQLTHGTRRRKFTNNQVVAIDHALKLGNTLQVIADYFNTSVLGIWRIKQGKTYSDITGR